MNNMKEKPRHYQKAIFIFCKIFESFHNYFKNNCLLGLKYLVFNTMVEKFEKFFNFKVDDLVKDYFKKPRVMMLRRDCRIGKEN